MNGLLESKVIQNFNEDGTDVFIMMSSDTVEEVMSLHGEKYFDVVNQSVVMDIVDKHITTENFSIQLGFEGNIKYEMETTITQHLKDNMNKKSKTNLRNGSEDELIEYLSGKVN